MRIPLAFLSIVLAFTSAAAQGIRKVDFKNFTYPLSGPTLGHNGLKWLDPGKRGRLTLINGKDKEEPPGFTLQSVKFVDVTGDKNDDAIVVIHLKTGGTQQTDYVYIYSFVDGKPKILAYCHTGDRGYSGLADVYGKNGELVVELLDPSKRDGDCCSSGIIRTRYKWKDGRFEQAGPHRSLRLQEP